MEITLNQARDIALKTMREAESNRAKSTEPNIPGIPLDFVVFSKSRLSVFRFKIRPDDSWDMLIRREYHWAFHDNVGLATALSYHVDPDNEVFLGYE
jgi:hypothetical protein